MSGITDIEIKTKQFIKLGLDEDQIVEKILMNAKGGIVKTDVIPIVKNIVKKYPAYETIQEIMRSYIIYPVEDDSKIFIYNPKSHNTTPMRKDYLGKAFAKSFDLMDRSFTAESTYEPLNKSKLFKNEIGLWQFNVYNPPFWYSDYYFGRVAEVPAQSTLPEIYKRFMHHLFASNERCIDYALHWMANSIQDRNIPFLILIGAQGAGKTKLAEILFEVHGEKNYAKVNNNILKKDFNIAYKNTRFIYMDEIKTKDDEQANKIKDFANGIITVEGKHLSSETIRNHASTLISSNNYNAIQFEGNDRRFSILDITGSDLRNSFSIPEIESLLDKKNIEELSRYLFHFKVDIDFVGKAFSGITTKTLRDLSLKDWERFMIDDQCQEFAGSSRDYHDIKEDIKNKMSVTIRYSDIINLSKKLKGYFECKKGSKTVNGIVKRFDEIVFVEKSKQPKDRDN